MKKRYIALILAFAMLFSVAAGGCNSNVQPSADSSSTSAAQPSSSQQGNSSADDPVEIHPMRYVTPGTLPTEAEQVLAEVNKKLQSDGVNIEVEVVRIPWDMYDQKVNLMLSTGEPFELIHAMYDVKNMNNMASMGALAPIDEYLDQYQSLVEKFDDMFWEGCRYQGKTYAVPDYWTTMDKINGYITVIQDEMEKYTTDFPADDVDAFIDLSQKMQKGILDEKGLNAYHWVHQLTIPPYWLHRTYEEWPFYVETTLGVAMINQDGSVDSYYESDIFKKDCEIYKRMYDLGLIHPDILNAAHEEKYDDMKNGAALPSPTFSYSDEISLKEEYPDSSIEMYMMAPEKPHLVTSLGNVNAISATSEDKESGLKFLNWLYESKENHDLFHYGIEGQHYTASAENRYEPIVDESGQALYYMDTWMSGYMPYIRYREDMPEKGIKWTEEESDNVVYSPAAAFMFDSTNVSSEITNLQTEIIASIYPLKMGLVDYDTNYPQAIEKLKKAGLDTYLEEYRKQFAAYLEENPAFLQ